MLDLTPACAALADRVEAVGDHELGLPTPCAGWAVRDLLAHLDLVAGGDGRPVEDRTDLAVRLRTVPAAWADPAAWEGASGDPELPNATWGRIALTEAVVHGWDLAVARGEAFELPDETLRACLEHVEEFVPAAPLSELWGRGPQPVGAAAGVLDRIVAATGRRPAEHLWPRST
ncbi:maleylpyruvate isomerase N-terminal domain-containing protein [Pseudonocardia phyllosphaerae]|uniref:maleylpyruvate isomerase N-terminal domain-containing protein n=1 Tax=Pseudonocardia phyllosphaerae TaxID=3390502 RepID=UPI0039786F82